MLSMKFRIWPFQIDKNELSDIFWWLELRRHWYFDIFLERIPKLMPEILFTVSVCKQRCLARAAFPPAISWGATNEKLTDTASRAGKFEIRHLCHNSVSLQNAHKVAKRNLWTMEIFSVWVSCWNRRTLSPWNCFVVVVLFLGLF